MISFQRDNTIFNFRAAAIVRRAGAVLLHQAEGDDFWCLPGGRVEMGEPAEMAVAREMMEELGIGCRVVSSALVIENFFEHAGMGGHELGFYFNVEIDDTALAPMEVDHYGTEGNQRLIFRWFPIAELTAVTFYPQPLKTWLTEASPAFCLIVNQHPHVKLASAD